MKILKYKRASEHNLGQSEVTWLLDPPRPQQQPGRVWAGVEAFQVTVEYYLLAFLSILKLFQSSFV